MKRNVIIKRTLLSLLVVFLIIPHTIVAENDNTLRKKATSINELMGISEVDTDLSNCFLTVDDGTTKETYELSTGTDPYKYGGKFPLNEGYSYNFIYKDAITIGSNKYSISVNISDVDIKSTDRLDYQYILIEDGTKVDQDGNLLKKGLLTVSSEYTKNKESSGLTWPVIWKDYSTEYTVNQTFLDSEGNPVHLDFFVCIQDIDQSDYLFDTSDRELLYQDAKGQTTWNSNDWASDNMLVTSDGVVRDTSKGYIESDGFGGFKEAMLYIPLFDNETGIETRINGWGDVIHYPRIFQIKKADYIVEYYYQEEDSTGAGVFDDDGNAVYPSEPLSSDTRNGVVGNTVEITEDDKKPTTTDDRDKRYVLDSSKESDYSGIIVEGDNPLVLKVYFKRVFKVVYNDGVTDETVFDDQITEKIPYGESTPVFNDGKDPVREGYDFINWNPLVEEKVYKDGYYEAQWDPWKYYIKYEPNGGSGKMATQEFNYSNKEMKSKANEFTRDGYKFIGFLYRDKEGVTHLYPSVEDFRTELVEKWGKNQTITLIAQWEKLPEPKIIYYSIPVTGVE